ncbi:transporter substrate-binding domain-containing protein [Nocardioides anomalus]|uniref:Transporter substrate-binding domain-containing protein n=1 Tax=Nocardioides anomalus TaxID=2712223 RepID=A0A6G6WAF6_9ACTN|nr:transporter substrate-binding domain-containing protein [Nocardioides anomalus]QIG42020.1 transporter substrate-binding domain-containing protein [Nocardioides anomalus]
MKRNSLWRRAAVIGTTMALAVGLAACGDDSDSGSDGGSGGGDSSSASGLMKDGTLTVGMNLQFEPEMYLDDNNQPAGYDVDLLNKLADDMGVKLDIVNLDFDGLIPGLQSKKFDMVSVGLTATDERKKVIDFSREYVPYVSVLAVPQDDDGPFTIDNYNTPDTRLTALQGSSGEQLAKDTFPNANVEGFSQQNAALLEVGTGRAQGSVLEDYILAQYIKSNPDQIKQADLPDPLAIGYGSWAVQKGNSALVDELNSFLCTAQNDGTLAEAYAKNFGVEDFPEMPAGC